MFNYSKIFETQSTPDHVLAVLSSKLEYKINKDYSFEEHSSPYLRPAIENIGLLTGVITTIGNKTVIEIKFGLSIMGVVALGIGGFFGVTGVIFAIGKNDLSQLIGLLPLCLLFLVVRVTYALNCAKKLVEFKEALAIK